MEIEINEKGLSLVEVLVASTIFLIFVAGVMSIFSRYKGQARISAERQELEANKEFLGSLISRDIENAGRGIIGYQNHTYGSEPAGFQTNNAYAASSGGEITKISAASEEILSTTAIGSTTGSVTVRMNNTGYIELRGSNSGSVRLSVAGDPAGYRIVLTAGGKNYDAGPHNPGAVYQISLVPDAENRKAAILSLIDETKSANYELFRVFENIPAGEISVAVFIAQTGDRLSVSLQGYPLIHKERTSVLTTMMFYDEQNGREISEPILFDGNRVTVFSADDRTEESFISSAFTPSTDSQITVNRINSGSVKRGDYLLVIDYNEKTAALLEVVEASQNNTNATLAVAAVRSLNAAWGRYTTLSSSLGHTFPQGSKVVKLEAPVSYQIEAGDRLVRKIGERAETAAFGVKSINYNIESGANGPVYVIEFTAEADGRNSDTGEFKPSAKYVYRATPQALNVANMTE